MTDAQYNDWLADKSAIRLLLAEVAARISGVETTRYMSTSAYVTNAGETPAHQYYSPVMSANAQISEQLSLTGEASMSIGEIELDNTAGGLDTWLGDVWANRRCQLYLGDPRWPRADFRLVFDGIVADIGSKSRTMLALKLRDKLQRLNTAISEVKLGGTTTNKDSLLPYAFGEVHNVTPLLTNPATLEYQVHNGALEGIFEVRDNGLPVSVTVSLTTGKFTLNQSPDGAITVSAQGDKPAAYTNTVSGLVQRLVTGYGKVADRFVTDDLDTTQLAAFDTANPQPTGLWVPERMNVLNACRELADSVGAQAVMSRVGKLRLLKVELPVQAGAVAYDIYPHNMEEKNLAITTRTDVVSSIKLGFNKNWTMQPGLLTALSAADKELFDTEWLTSTQSDASVASIYKLSTEPVQQDTMLLRRTDADAEAVRLLSLRKVPRQVYEFTGFAELFAMELGQTATIYHPRFGLSAGATGMIVSLKTSWIKNRITVGVLV